MARAMNVRDNGVGPALVTYILWYDCHHERELIAMTTTKRTLLIAALLAASSPAQAFKCPRPAEVVLLHPAHPSPLTPQRRGTIAMDVAL